MSESSLSNILTVHLICYDSVSYRLGSVDLVVKNSRDADKVYREYKPVIGWKKTGYSYYGSY